MSLGFPLIVKKGVLHGFKEITAKIFIILEILFA
jgi:hypothetical protein